MHSWSKLAVLVMLLSSFALAASPANAVVPRENCVTMVEKTESREKILSAREVCGTKEDLSKITSEQSLLVTWYEHANFQGRSNPVYGDFGPCDWEGYTIPVIGMWSAMISSYDLYGTCNWATYWDPDGNNSGSRGGDQWYVGDFFNDRIWKMKVWYSWP
ncbi:hypothetical protein GCM10009789_82770 [Kribbella sancticallisti]|uniref:Peptidase inhibitor family I36 n=1 Tax=Kribbella sancticallisti TaxID=460087 RepID=A0ABN2EUY8_9ACTN